MDVANHLVCAFHMLNAYNEGKMWLCNCLSCQTTRQNAILVAAMQKEVYSKPPKCQKTNQPINFVEID